MKFTMGNGEGGVHTHDRTLLQQMGFQDPDKKDLRHTWAEQYLSVGERRGTLINHALRLRGWTSERLEHLQVTGCEVESLVLKGRGQFRSFIGYADVVVGLCWPGGTHWSERQPVSRGRIIVEVKIGEVSIDSATRQLKIYEEFLYVLPDHYGCGEVSIEALVLATPYPIDTGDAEFLKQNGIVHVRLGADFERYCEERTASSRPADSLEL